MIETIEYDSQIYPAFQAEGNAAQFVLPFAKKVCKGHGLDIGFGNMDWKFPGAYPVDLNMKNSFHAMRLPQCHKWDFIFSSHLLEHLPDWVGVLDYWRANIRTGGVLFLYLPHPDQVYWRPYHNRKHINIMHPADVHQYLVERTFKNIFVSGRDLNHSFAVMAEK